jgi:diaminopimelate epimerase
MRALGQVQASKQDPLSFSKMAGAGNDFVMIDNRAGRVADAAELTRRICTPHLSVGADGLILIETSPRATFRMRYLNADGSEAAFCANGTRCAARFAFLNVIAPRRMTIETGTGMVGAEVGEGGQVTLALQPPHSFRAERPLSVGDRVIRGSSIMVGVPHYVIFLRDDPSTALGTGLWSQDIAPLGAAIRKHPELMPAGANVNFVVVRGSHAIEVRTYERGVEAETLSCGSGVVASSVVSAMFGKTKSPVSVKTRSGIALEVAFALDGGEPHDVRLTGDARLIYKSALTPETIEGFDPDWFRNPVEPVLSAEQ